MIRFYIVQYYDDQFIVNADSEQEAYKIIVGEDEEEAERVLSHANWTCKEITLNKGDQLMLLSK